MIKGSKRIYSNHRDRDFSERQFRKVSYDILVEAIRFLEKNARTTDTYNKARVSVELFKGHEFHREYNGDQEYPEKLPGRDYLYKSAIYQVRNLTSCEHSAMVESTNPNKRDNEDKIRIETQAETAGTLENSLKDLPLPFWKNVSRE